jgi:hypothetical protein
MRDNDTVTSAASVETWRCGKPSQTWRGVVKPVLEKHEVGLAPKHNPGPPFVVGDVIMCNVLGSIKGMQQGFVLMADHPKYCIQLKEGRTVGTSIRRTRYNYLGFFPICHVEPSHPVLILGQESQPSFGGCFQPFLTRLSGFALPIS